MAKYKINFFVDYVDTPLWGGDDITRTKWGNPIEPKDLPISKDLSDGLERFTTPIASSEGYIDSLNDRIELKAVKDDLIQRLRDELGSDFEIEDHM